jgi:hypothetical protein
MPSLAESFRGRSLSPARAVLLGTLTVGVLDGLDAVLFFGARGVAPIKIFQSIASGVLGRAAFGGGLPVAALGFALHFFIAFCIVLAYVLASRRLPALTRYAAEMGVLYGLVVYEVMNEVVLPLSNAGAGPRPIPVLVNGLLIHMLAVGLPSALFARAATPPPERTPAPAVAL